MKKVMIGQYIPGDSMIHRLDPRAKLIAVFIFVVIIFLANNWFTYALIGGFTFLAAALSGVSPSYLYKGLRPMLLIILFTFLFHVFMTKEGALYFEWGWLHVYEGGLVNGIFISLRILLIIVTTTLLTLTTTPIEVTDGTETLLAPLKKLRFPVHEFALMMSISLRFIPTIMEETEKIMKAQTARGTDFSSGPIKERLTAIISLIVPLFVSAFKRAEDLAIAMEARGYRGGEGRTKLRLLAWKKIDTVMLFLVVLLISALLYFRTWSL